MPDTKIVTFSGKQYPVNPLRLKHLKKITQILADPAPTAVYQNLSRWFPFVCDAVGVTEDQLEEATMQEVSDAWEVILDASGIKIVNKPGEQKPTAASTGDSSTDASPLPSAGTTVQ